jgi:hypothetical protein
MESWDALADEFGLIDAARLRPAGCGRREVDRLVSDGHWVHLTRGWYALSSALMPEAVESPAERRRLRHALLTRALVANFEGRAFASHHSALVLHGLPIYAADLRQVHVTRVDDDHSRSRRGLTVHEAVPGASTTGEIVEPSVAVFQAGMVNGPLASLIAADAALHRGLVTSDALERASGLLRGPRAHPVRRTLARADGRAESPGETRLREAVRMMGFRATPQVAIRDGSFLAVVDLALDDVPVALEFDGFVKYGRRNPFSTEVTPADVVVAEKIREDHVRALRWAMVRTIWPELDDLVILRRRVEAAIELARLLRAA